MRDCGKFYKCSNGRGYLFDCPAGEHWSVKLDRCDYPELAGCRIDGRHQYKLKKITAIKASDMGNSETENSSNVVDEFEIDPRCEGGDPFKPLHFSHPNDCTKFYKCYMGKAYVIRCPKGQHFAQRLNRCEHPTLARCSVVKAAAASLVVPYMDIPEEKLQKMHTILDDIDYTINDERCKMNGDDDRFHPLHFAHPSECQMFYKCFNKLAYKVSCPEGLHYNAKKEACDYPAIANCKASVDIQRAQHNVEMPSIPDCSHGRNVNFGVQSSLKYYFQCRNGEAYLMECANDEFFNINIMQCDHLQQENNDNLKNNINRVPQPPQDRPTFTPYKPNTYQNYYQPMWNNYPNWGGVNPSYPAWGVNQQYPTYPQFDAPKLPAKNDIIKAPAKPPVKQPESFPELPHLVVPQAPNAPTQQQQPQQNMPDFPSWLPQPNANIGFPQMPTRVSPPRDSSSSSSHADSDTHGFDFTRGKVSSRCPLSDDPMHPVHLSHETDCGKFYKCFQQKAFLLNCPPEQEFSSTLQRCDFHLLANCDPIDLIKQKIQN